MRFAFVFALWWAVGAAGYIYWHSLNFDITTVDIPVIAAVGMTGPAAWPLGWLIEEPHHWESHVFLRKRKQ